MQFQAASRPGDQLEFDLAVVYCDVHTAGHVVRSTNASAAMGKGFDTVGFVKAIPAIVLTLILLAVQGTFDRGYGTHSSAIEVLQLRLARGEISPQEYGSLRGELRR
ncbi:MAG: hypothetical protein V3U33_00560 [candidate division NC10 bacterium]